MKKIPVAVFLAALISGAALAQTFEVGVFGGYPRWGHPAMGSLSDSPGDHDTRLKGEYSYGARITLNTKGYWGAELGYTNVRTKFTTNYSTTLSDGTAFSAVLEDKVKAQMLTGNVIAYFMPRGERWRPYATGGLQVYHYSAPHFPQWPGGGSRNYGFNYGFGLKLKLLPHTLVRIDGRDYIGGRPYDQLQFSQGTFGAGSIHLLEATTGFSITF